MCSKQDRPIRLCSPYLPIGKKIKTRPFLLASKPNEIRQALRLLKSKGLSTPSHHRDKREHKELLKEDSASKLDNQKFIFCKICLSPIRQGLLMAAGTGRR